MDIPFVSGSNEDIVQDVPVLVSRVLSGCIVLRSREADCLAVVNNMEIENTLTCTVITEKSADTMCLSDTGVILIIDSERL